MFDYYLDLSSSNTGVVLVSKNINEPIIITSWDFSKIKINKELEKIEERTKYFIKEKKQMEELYQFMNEAKQKIEIADSFKDKEDVRDAGGT